MKKISEIDGILGHDKIAKWLFYINTMH